MKTSKDPALDKYGIILRDPDYDPFADFMALGDGYMRGKWYSEDLRETLYQLTKSRDIVKLVKDKTWDRETAERLNLQAKFPHDVIYAHYDIGNHVFRAMLDKTMSYTCAYWRSGATNLDDAQHDKNELICQKLELEPGMTVADLGCGFGSFARHAQENHGVSVIGYTLSEQQAKIAKDFCDVRVADYADLTGKYDRVLSMGLLEHVGPKNYRRYMKTVYRCLHDSGISYFQTIGYNTSYHSSHPWVNTRIFPNGVLPSLSQLTQAMEGLFTLEDLESIGPDYALTAEAWLDNYNKAVLDGELDVSSQFDLMWVFYLQFFIAAFRTREFQLWQVVMTKRREQQPRRV